MSPGLPPRPSSLPAVVVVARARLPLRNSAGHSIVIAVQSMHQGVRLRSFEARQSQATHFITQSGTE
jgi:hypothetical protein